MAPRNTDAEEIVRLRNERDAGVMALGVYLGPWEYHERSGDTTKAVLHVDGHGRHAQAEVLLHGTDSTLVSLFFQHSDHLGSGHILTASDGTLLSQEEYFPYGRASDRRDTRNRYRYIGVEQDEDTSLCMTGPRTYDPVSGRFLQADPMINPQRSPFEYSSSTPVVRLDPGGYADFGPLLLLQLKSDQGGPAVPFDTSKIDSTVAGYAEKGIPTEFMRQAASEASLVAIPVHGQAQTAAPLAFMYQAASMGQPTMRLPEDIAQLSAGTLAHESTHAALLQRTSNDPGLRAVVGGQAQMMVETGQSWSMTSYHNAQEPMAQYVEVRVAGAAAKIDNLRYLREGLDAGEITLDEFGVEAEKARDAYADLIDPANITYGSFRGVTPEAATWLDENLLEGMPRDLFEMDAVQSILPSSVGRP